MVARFNAPVAGKPLVEREWDFPLEWRPNCQPLQGLWLRAQYGHSGTDQNNALTTTDEISVVLNYTVKLF